MVSTPSTVYPNKTHMDTMVPILKHAMILHAQLGLFAGRVGSVLGEKNLSKSSGRFFKN